MIDNSEVMESTEVVDPVILTDKINTIVTVITDSILQLREVAEQLTKSRYIERKTTDIETINIIVRRYFGIEEETFLSVSRKREIVQARQISMHFCSLYTKASLALIGSKVGGKDHTTVLHSCKNVSNLIDTDKKIRKFVSEINDIIKNVIVQP